MRSSIYGNRYASVRWAGSFLVLLSIVATSETAKGQNSLQELVSASKKEGRLVLMSGPSTWGFERGVKALEQAFNQKFGLTTQVRFVPGPDMGRMAASVLDEQRAGQKSSTDILASGLDHVLRLIKAETLESVPWNKYFPELGGERVEFGGQIVQFYTQIYGGLYNTKMLPDAGKIRRMDDLLNPKWKGVMAAPPYAGGPARAVVAVPGLDLERMKNFYRRYNSLLAGFIRCGEEERIASGEFLLFFPACDILSSIVEAKSKRMPLGGFVPEDFAAIEYKYWSVPRNAPNPSTAKLWVGFALSREGNRVYEQHSHNSSHLIEGSEASRYVNEMTRKGIRFTSLRATEQQHGLEAILQVRKEIEDILKR